MRWPFSRRQQNIEPGEVSEIVSRNVALARHLDGSDRERLGVLVAELIGSKRWEAVAGAELSNEVLVTVAANAAVPILRLDTWTYHNVRAVIIWPTTTITRGPSAGPSRGVVSDEATAIIGQAHANEGPISLSWDAALAESRNPAAGRNVIIHEFAHKIDMSDGYTDGTPPLNGQALKRWSDVLADEYERANARPSDSILRPYAWTNPAEFFAVATEAFFCLPTSLAEGKPVLYSALSSFYEQDPRGRT